MPRDIETAVCVWADRHLPIELAADQARALEAAPGVDGVLVCDQIPGWIPQQLWNPRHTPLAAMVGDADSSSDAFTLGAYIAALAPSLRLSVSTDSIRRGPAELIQTMLTLANMTGGNASFQVGGGEAKQCTPFGHKRTQGMSRMKDLFTIFELLMEADGPIDYEGRRWTWRNATLGEAIPHRPELLALGGGPALIDHATSHCDGLAMMNPSVFPTVEAFAEGRERIRADVERKGRDPEAFRFAVWFPVLLHEDAEVIEAALENDLVRWIAATAGRIGPAQMWRDSGLEPPIPDGWVYFEDFLPYETDQTFIDDVLTNTTIEHSRAFWMAGDSAAVADEIATWVEAGVDWVCPIDYATLMALGIGEADGSLKRQAEVCSLLQTRTKEPA